MLHHQHRYAARLGALFLSVLFLGACSNEPPGCADEKTLSLVTDVFWDTVAKNAVNPEEKPKLAAGRPNFRVSLEAPRVKAKQADAGRLVCVGTLRVALTDSASARVDKM